MILRVREEVNLLHGNGPQLSLAEEGVEQVGINSRTVGWAEQGTRSAPKDAQFPSVSSSGCFPGSGWDGCPCPMWQWCHARGNAS